LYRTILPRKTTSVFLQPTGQSVKNQHPNENVCDAPLVDDISKANVIKTISDIRAKSTVITELENQGKVKLIGAMYDVSTGKVSFL
jgi:carbonic anhydrase